MPAAQAPRRLIKGFTAKVYYWHRRAKGNVRCSDWLGAAELHAALRTEARTPVLA
jgi:hypothetical protein